MYSPDTDVYNIGLTTIQENKEVIVQINVPQSTTQLYVHLNKLISALQGDLDLATIPKDHLPRVFQMLYVCCGCDYISYFAGMGKGMFCNVFFQHASFITGRNMPGELSFTTVGTIKENFLSFLRLIGTLYFKKHYSAMVSLRGAETPQHLLKGSCMDNAQQHESWHDDIRSIVSNCITSEEDRMPFTYLNVATLAPFLLGCTALSEYPWTRSLCASPTTRTKRMENSEQWVFCGLGVSSTSEANTGDDWFSHEGLFLQERMYNNEMQLCQERIPMWIRV